MKRSKARARAAAKINLTFEILGTRPDGYHEVETLLLSVDLFDQITIELDTTSKNSVMLRSYKSEVAGDFPMDDSNLVVKAVRKYLAHLRSDDSGAYSVVADVEKMIPIEAGLAGGSADAAATLHALNHLFDGKLTEDQLLKVAAELGADVPFALKGGLCLGTERGDKLEYQDLTPSLYMVLVKPRNLSISTPQMFKTFDRLSNSPGLKAGSKSRKALQSLLDGDLDQFYAGLSNDFEQVYFELYPEIAALKSKMLELGCWTVNLTGSGPTIYGTVPSLNKGNLVARGLVSDRMNNPNSEYLKHGSLEIKVVRSSPDSVRILGP